MNFWNERKGFAVTEATVKAMGVVNLKGTATLETMGLFPIDYQRPAFDEWTQRLVADNLPSKDGGHYVWGFQVVDLTDEEKQRVVDAAKQQKLAALADRRWRAETGGITTSDGLKVNTSRESQAAIMGLRLSEYSSTIDFKLDTGWVTLNGTGIEVLQRMVQEHVQFCFRHEHELAEAINAAADGPAVEAIDIEAGWPQVDSQQA